MTSQPTIIETVRRIIRLPDEMMEMMDPYGMMYSGRSDFIVVAVREFIGDTIGMMDHVVSDNSTVDGDRRMSDISSSWESKVRQLVDTVDDMDRSGKSSTSMVTFPSGLVDMMQFIIDRITSLRNMTFFCRVAVLYRIGILQEQSRVFQRLQDSLSFAHIPKGKPIDEGCKRKGEAYIEKSP
ncbi:MAG: hypothetical protein IJT54_09160 [Candidatus Methanomethylophilaceae archaeon]|nr:hypothetical protein [Candidatus Methanomethylophilaceae archaeon]